LIFSKNSFRITIVKNKYTGNPKGYGYIEFEDIGGVENALLLSESILAGRQITVMKKRTNTPRKGGKKRFRGNRGR